MNMVKFGTSDGSLVAGAAYQSSFGNLPDRTVYKHYPPLKDGAGARDIFASKEKGANEITFNIKSLAIDSNIYATGTSYTSTSGSLPSLLPIYLDRDITDITKFRTPLINGLIKKVSNRGAYADFNQLTAKGAASFKSEDAALPETDDTYDRKTFAIKYVYAVGRITGPMLASIKEYQDAMRLEVANKRQSLVELLEKQICRGTTGGDASGFSGFPELVTTNTEDQSSATITIDKLRTAIRTCREANGNPDLIVTDYKTLDDVKALIQTQLRYNAPTANIAFGIQAIEFEGLPIVPDLGMSTTATSRELHIYDTSVWEWRILQDETMEELAKTNDSMKFMVKWYGTLITKAEMFNYRIYGLA